MSNLYEILIRFDGGVFVGAHARDAAVIRNPLTGQDLVQVGDARAISIDAALLAQLVAGIDVPPVVGEPTVDQLRGAARDRINAAYTAATDALAAGYPDRERESWHAQTSEATAVLADPAAATPWIDAAAGERGIDRVDLAARIAANDLAYRQLHGTLSGIRQRLAAQINVANDAGALEAIQWPSPEAAAETEMPQ